MKIFVIHSGADKAKVKEVIEELNKKTSSSEFLMLSGDKKIWKPEAKRKIKDAQLVVFFVGKDSHKSKNIGWEIDKAINLKKQIITVKLDKSFADHENLKVANRFTGEKKRIDIEVSAENLVKKLNDYISGDYGLFNQPLDEIDNNLLLEQYKMFLQTSEDLVMRRQNVSSFYISVSSALVAIYAAIVGIGSDKIWKSISGLVFAAVGIILSYSWIKILRSYGDLNSSKMRIISIIEKKMPASMYDAEWRAQSDKLNSKPYVSFTKCETRIPKLLIWVYAFIGVLSIALIISFKIKGF